MLLTKNNFWLSVTGTFFIFLSGGVQWWSYFIADYMLYLNGMFISLVYILYSKKSVPLIIAGVIFIVSAYGNLFNLYPPFRSRFYGYIFFFWSAFCFNEKIFKQLKKVGD
jgi:hypothetical protein